MRITVRALRRLSIVGMTLAFTGLGSSAAQTAGQVSASELKAAVDKVFAAADTNRDDRISRDEFVTYAAKQNQHTTREVVEQAIDKIFDPIDLDGDGYITRTELALYNLVAVGGECEDCDGDRQGR